MTSPGSSTITVGTANIKLEGITAKGYGTFTQKEYGDFEESLGLRRGFSMSLMQEDDWSFVIKLHALLEAALAEALMKHTSGDLAASVKIWKRRTGGADGKVAAAKAAGLIDGPMEVFLNWLTRLRNLMVHHVENIYFNLESHVQSLDQSQRQDIVEALVVAGDDAARAKLLTDSPKTALLWSATAVVEKLVGPKEL